MAGNSHGCGCSFCRLRLDRNQPGVVDAHPGQRIRLVCRAEGFPRPTMEWQRNGQPLSSGRFAQCLALLPCALPSCGLWLCSVSSRTQGSLERWGCWALGLSRAWLVDRRNRPAKRGSG